MRRIVVAAVLAGSLASTVAAEGWRILDGKTAPEITASEWLNVPGGTPSRESLEGKVWLLMFFGIH